MEFPLTFQTIMYRFDEALLNFTFELLMNLNFGRITASIIY